MLLKKRHGTITHAFSQVLLTYLSSVIFGWRYRDPFPLSESSIPGKLIEGISTEKIIANHTVVGRTWGNAGMSHPVSVRLLRTLIRSGIPASCKQKTLILVPH